MNCKEAENLIPRYLDDSMDKDTLLEFISHIRECQNCYNELDTFFMIERAMETLKQSTDQSFDLSNILDEDLNRRWTMISRNETSVNMTVLFSILAAFSIIWILLDMYGILSLSYLL